MVVSGLGPVYLSPFVLVLLAFRGFLVRYGPSPSGDRVDLAIAASNSGVQSGGSFRALPFQIEIC